MTNDQRPTESTPLPAPVTGVARGGRGTGTALDDTQIYDVADFSPVLPAAAAQSASAAAQPLPPQSAAAEGPQGASEPELAPVPIDSVPVVAAPVAATLVASAGPRNPPSRTTTTSRARRVGAPVAGLAGLALAAGLAVLVGVVLGGVPMPDGAAAGGETAGPTPAAPAETDAPVGDGGNGDNDKDNKGKGNGRGNDDDD